MVNEITPDYQQNHLFPPNLEDWVPLDHPARFIRDFVDALNLEDLGFTFRKGPRGRSNYSNDLLLKVWLYGFFNRIYSTRDLERACHEHLSLIWLTGMNYPDHNTLWRFMKRNDKAMQSIFKSGIQIAAANNLVGLVLHALDGTKVRAQASIRTAHSRRKLKQALKDLDVKINEMMLKIKSAEKEEQGEYKLPEELQDAEVRKQAIKKALKELNDAGTNFLQPAEPDARMMKCDGKKFFGYNGQVIVDDESGLIVAEDVTKDETDYEQLVPMIKNVERTLGQAAEETVADKGYSSGPELEKAENEQMNVIVNLQEHMDEQEAPGEFHHSKFHYDSERDIVICPRGAKMTFHQIKRISSRQYDVRVYKCRCFLDCPDRFRCSQSKHGRTVRVNPYTPVIKRQIEKQRDSKVREKLKKRMGIVEPVFGVIKENMRFRRFTVRDIDGVKTQWALICTAVNLRKLFNFWRRQALSFS